MVVLQKTDDSTRQEHRGVVDAIWGGDLSLALCAFLKALSFISCIQQGAATKEIFRLDDICGVQKNIKGTHVNNDKENILVIPKLKDAAISLENRIATLTLQRDDVRNALTGTALVEDIVDTVNWANCAPEVSVLIITGDGKAFSSGGDVVAMRDRSDIFSGPPIKVQEQYRRGIQQMSLALHASEIPVIAAVNGAAIGAGFDLACMCDIRIASTRAQVSEAFINFGLTPGDGGAWFLQRLIGYQKAAELTFTGRLVSADEGQRLGLFLEVVEPDALLPRVCELAMQIAAARHGGTI